MRAALGNLERFLQDPGGLDPLIVCALAHAQFETIHPFLDGNGRIGRLLVTFLLCHAKALQRPVLYLSHYLKQHRTSYYDRLMAVRTAGDWEGWRRFFLTGVADVAREAEHTAGRIVQLREHARQTAQQAGLSATALRMLDYLFEWPLTTVNAAKDKLGVSYVAANNVIAELCRIGLITEVTRWRGENLPNFRERIIMQARFLGVDPGSQEGQSPTLFATDRRDRKTYIAQDGW